MAFWILNLLGEGSGKSASECDCKCKHYEIQIKQVFHFYLCCISFRLQVFTGSKKGTDASTNDNVCWQFVTSKLIMNDQCDQ
jgi:hypothetical protein